jgi:Holliday junction DNA helicase RuvA
MIASLQGKLAQINPPSVVIDIGGVGYLLQASMSTIYQLPQIGQDVYVHTHMIVREDAQLLYAFFTEDERSLFQALIKINGVGPKVALAILSNVSAVELVQWVEQDSIGSFKKIPGVGPKTAQRILLDLKDKLKKFHIQDKTQVVIGSNRRAQDEAFDALIALGYKSKEATNALNKISKDEGFSEPQDIIRAALKGLAR